MMTKSSSPNHHDVRQREMEVENYRLHSLQISSRNQKACLRSIYRGTTSAKSSDVVSHHYVPEITFVWKIAVCCMTVVVDTNVTCVGVLYDAFVGRPRTEQSFHFGR